MRRIIAALFAALTLLGVMATSSSPVGATPPQEVVLEDYIVLFPDLNVNKAVFINITARDFCNWLSEVEPFFAWEESFFLYQEYLAFLEAGGDPDDFFIQPPPTDPGPPPFFRPPPAIDPVIGIGVGTGQGAIVGRIDQELDIELWEFDENPSPLIGPCEDIAQQLADPEAEPWATGTARFQAKNNDVDFTGTRGVSFGDRTTAQVVDQAGNEYSYRNVFRLNGQCQTPEFAPPACLVDNSQLQPR